MGRTKKIIAAFAVLKPKERWSIFFPAISALIWILGKKSWKMDFLKSCFIHLLANDSLHIAKSNHAKW